jgi:hypothetical protein
MRAHPRLGRRLSLQRATLTVGPGERGNIAGNNDGNVTFASEGYCFCKRR